MPSDLSTIADPRFVLLAWAAGLVLVTGFVSVFKVVGPGFTWLTASTSAVLGLAGSLAENAWWARVAIVSIGVGMILARSRTVAGAIFVIAGILYLIQAGTLGGWLPALTATISLGGVTGEMMLGHWYLVDPRLPRWTLATLGYVGIVGLVGDATVLAGLGGFPGGGATLAFWVLATLSVLLMAGVLGALRYPAYSGVMAATGLSYLAVLTTLGVTFLGRALVAGLGPFAS